MTTSVTIGDTGIRVNFVSHFDKSLVLAKNLARIRATIRRIIGFFERILNFGAYTIRGDWGVQGIDCSMPVILVWLPR